MTAFGLAAPLGADAEALDALGVLRRALDTVGPDRLPAVVSLGPEDIVIIDLLVGLVAAPRIVTIDTGRLPEATYELLDRVREHFGIDVEVITPNPADVEPMVRERGVNLFYHSRDERLRCCEVRKVRPLGRVLSGAGGWITGLRRDQSKGRASTLKATLDLEHGAIVKVAPLADWSSDDVWAHIREHGLPYNALHDQGYPSIGCAPCTRAVAAGEDERSGRWWWETDGARECGLHVSSADRTAASTEAIR